MTKRLPLAVLQLALTLGPGPASAQIVLDADFDHGSLDEANSSAVGDFVQLAGRDNFNAGRWKWVYFSASGVQGRTPTFQIDDDFTTGGSNLNDHEMVYSYDQDEWFFFDNNARNASAETFTFSNTSPFTQDEVIVAYGLPYSVGRSVAHSQSIAASPWTTPTLTGGSDFVIGQSPGGVDDLGRTIAPQDLYGYKITDPGATGPKVKVGLLGGVHSNETLGNHTLEAMVDYLIGDSLDAALLRRRAEFYVYPMANPDGRLAGYNRSTVEEPDLDPNRFWDPPDYGGQSDIKAVGDAILADTGGSVDFFIDFHSTVQKDTSHFGFVDVDRNFHLNPFWLRLSELEPTMETFDASLINNTAARFGLVQLNAGFTITHETRFIAGENEDRFVMLGQNFGQAFADVLATPTGDLNFDGRIDAADYAVLVLNAETSTAGLSVIDAYARGDLNNDGVNDGFDFGLFKDLFIDANGLTAFSLLLAGVPEPTSFAMLVVAVVASVPHRRPQCQPHTPRHTLRAVVIAAAVLPCCVPQAEAQSILLHDFRFDDTADTDILNLVDSASSVTFREVDADNAAVVTNGFGQLDLSTKANDNFGSNNLFDLVTPLTEGVVFGVFEATWDFQSALNPAENEELRLSLISTGNSTVTAEFEIERSDADELILFGNAIGTGSDDTPIVTINDGNLTQTDNFVAVLQADLTADRFEVFYSNDNFGSFQSIGSGVLSPDRGVTSVRLVMNNDFADDNVLIDRVRIFQNELPFDLDPTPPELLTLQINPLSGHAAIVNSSGALVFDIDYYRIASSDNSLIEAGWSSLQDRSVDAIDGADPGATAGDTLGETWVEAGGSDEGVLSESFLLSSSVFGPGRVIPLGGILGGAADPETITFEYRDPMTGSITIGNVLVAELLPGDYNLDGSVDAADYTVWRDNASGLFTQAEYTVWANNYGRTGVAATAIPEPSAALMATLLAAASYARRS